MGHDLLVADLNDNLADFRLVLQGFEGSYCIIEIESFRNNRPDVILLCELCKLGRRIPAECDTALHYSHVSAVDENTAYTHLSCRRKVAQARPLRRHPVEHSRCLSD